MVVGPVDIAVVAVAFAAVAFAAAEARIAADTVARIRAGIAAGFEFAGGWVGLADVVLVV